TTVATIPSSYVLATFSDSSTATNAGNFSATIDYGDGTSGPGIILPINSTPGSFQVIGSHTYTTPGAFTAQVTIFNDTGTLAPVFSAVTVNSPLSLTGSGIDDIAGRRSNTLVGTFSDVDTSALPSDFTAFVNWGDGSPGSIATIIAMSNGTSNFFAIYAGHSSSTDGASP